MIAHHYGILKKEEIITSSKLFNLCKRSWRGCLSADRNQFGKLELIFFACVLTIFPMLAMNFTFRVQLTTVIIFGAILVMSVVDVIWIT